MFFAYAQKGGGVCIAAANTAGFPVDGAKSCQIALPHCSLACTPPGEHLWKLKRPSSLRTIKCFIVIIIPF